MQNESDLDKKRKRTFFILCSSITIGAFLILSIVNYLERDCQEIIFNMIIISIMVAGLLGVIKWHKDIVVYRIVHFLICLNFFYSVAMGAGQETVLYWVSIMPLLFFYFMGKREGLMWTMIFSCCVFFILLFPSLIGAHSYPAVIVPRFMITLLILIIISYGLESSRDKYSRLLKEKNEVLSKEKELLEKALGEIKPLSGLLPICCHCKKIRDDQGYWQQVETYVGSHTHADFSHGICPECFKKLYPEYQEISGNNKETK